MPEPTYRRRTSLLLALALAPLLALSGCQTTTPELRADANNARAVGDFDAAIASRRAVVERHPSNPLYRYELGQVLLEAGEPGAAREQLFLAYEAVPDNATYLEAYADGLIATRDLETMYAVLRDAIPPKGERWPAYVRLGDYAFRAGHADEAERAYVEAGNLATTLDPEPQRRLASLYRRVGDTPNEIARLRMILWFNPADAEAAPRLRQLGEVPGPGFRLFPRGEYTP
ncbi:MAG: tetratricopeptide repeat protein [Planctomycetota bacterium]